MIPLLLLALGIAPLVPLQAAPDPARTSAEGAQEPFVQTWLQPRRVATPNQLAESYLGTSMLAGAMTVNQDPEGDMPREVAFLPDGSAAVIVNRDTDTLTILDVATLSISDTVELGDFPVHLAVSPLGDVVVVTNVLDHTVSLVDPVTAAVTATIPVTGEQPYRVAISADGSTAVVGVINDAVSSSFSVIDLGTATETASFSSSSQGVMGFFFTPESGISGNIYTQFALTPDGQTVILPDRAANVVRFYDVASGLETAAPATAGAPTSIDLSDDGTLCVVGHESGVNALSVIDVGTATVTASHSVAGFLQAQVVAITPDKSHVLCAISNTTLFVNLASGVTTASISTGVVGDIVLSFDGQFAFVSNFNSRVIDVASQTLVATLPLAPSTESAVSPIEHRVVALNNRFREDVHLYSTNGAGSFVEGRVLTGEPDEGDAPRSLAISPDGGTALVGCNTSRNAALVDVATGTVTGYVECGDRPLEVAISPDGVHGVVCNGDENTVTIIDMASGAAVAQIPIFSRPTDVVISPDGSTAYVTSVSGSDRLHRISLAGAASAATGSLVTGQLGSIGYSYTVTSDLAISPDGGTLAVCVSFDDELMIVDTASFTEVARVNVGDFPIQVAFRADSAAAYVVNSFSDNVSVVSIAGAASALSATIPGIEFPLVNVADDTGAWHFVGNFDFNAPRLYVIDTSTNTVAASLALPSIARAAVYSASDGVLYVATTGGELLVVTAAGASSVVSDQVALVGPASALVFSEALGVAVCAQPGTTDEVDLVDVHPGPWTDLGQGLAGGFGVPLLDGAGDLLVGSTTTLTLSLAALGSTATLVVGLSELAVPFKGGTMVPAVDAILGGFPIGPTGILVLSAPWPAGIPSGLELWFQEWIVDAGGPSGFSATNGLKATVP